MSIPAIPAESTTPSSPTTSPYKNSSLNPDAQEFVFQPQQQFSGLNASAPEFSMLEPTPSIVMFPIPIPNPQPVMMQSIHINIPSINHHHHHLVYHDTEYQQSSPFKQQGDDLSPSKSPTSSTPEHTPAPKLATIEEESEIDWGETKRCIFFADEDDVKEDEADADVCRDVSSGKVLDGVVRKYCLDELISFRSFSNCQSPPSGETLFMQSFLSRVACADRSAIDEAIVAMDNPLPAIYFQQQRPSTKRVVGRNNFRPRFDPRRPFVPRNPRPRTPVTLSAKSSRKHMKAVPQTELDALMKQCRSILNKITPENHSRLTSRLFELVELKVKCYEHLEVVLSAIVDVGVMQTAFVERYVDILMDMAKKTDDMVKSWDWIRECERNGEEIDSDKIVKIVVRKCCRKNHELYWHTCNLDRQKVFLQSFITCEVGETCPRETAGLMIDYCMNEESALKMKRKFFGSEVLLAELCKRKMLPEMLICRGVINPLLRVCPAREYDPMGSEDDEWRGPVCEEELEAVCKLLQVIGFELEAKAPKWMTTYIEVIESLASHLESRMKFMVMDLRDLRAANWGRPRPERKMRRRSHFEDVSKGYRGGAFGSSHDNTYRRRNNRGRTSYAYRNQTRYVRKD